MTAAAIHEPAIVATPSLSILSLKHPSLLAFTSLPTVARSMAIVVRDLAVVAAVVEYEKSAIIIS